MIKGKFSIMMSRSTKRMKLSVEEYKKIKSTDTTKEENIVLASTMTISDRK